MVRSIEVITVSLDTTELLMGKREEVGIKLGTILIKHF